MVKVISLHNFLKQDIFSVDELIDTIAIPPDIVLLAQSDNKILVRDLSLIDDNGYIIPTIDQVVKLIYSVQGNYIGTLEKKPRRNGMDVFYIRIYINWESLKKYKEAPPMRTRIAGRVTPLSQNHEGLEMIEIPTSSMPDNITCCPISGNLIMASKNILTIYKLMIQMHDISKIYFIDFEQVSVDFLLSFIPSRIQMVENMVAVQNDEFLHVFKIVSYQPTPVNETKDKESSGDESENLNENSTRFLDKLEPINYDNLSAGKRDFQSELKKISKSSIPIRHDFPTISVSRSLESSCSDVYKQNPFLVGQDLVVNMISTSTSEGSKHPYKTENILQYQLMPLMLGSSTNREMQEKFTSLILKPFYSNDADSGTGKRKLLESKAAGKLKTVACFFGTQQEGYLYCFDFEAPNKEVSLKRYVVYPFTAPALQVQLEDHFVHVLTETGLETYTMRAAKHLLTNDDRTSCPSSDDPVCLIGLRPFVYVFKMCITNQNLILFACNQESSNGVWTLYKLKIPLPSNVWYDFSTVAEGNKWESPATYSHLIGEGHLILKTYLHTITWTSAVEGSRNHIHSPVPLVNDNEKKLVEKLYNESCALLGDFHIMEKDFLKASNYYRMCNYKINEIVKRIESLANKMPDRYRSNFDLNITRKGLIYHLKKCLTYYDEKYYAFTGNREEFYNLEIGNIINTLLDYLEKERDLSISDLILDSIVLREFSTDRILKMMKNVLSASSPPKEKDALSLALMCIQRDQMDQAKTVLQSMTPESLQNLILQYHHLLFEKNSFVKEISFTELSMVLMETYPAVMGKILSFMISEKHALSLPMLLKIFLAVLPSGCIQSINSSVVLLIVLEDYFKYYFRCPANKFDLKSVEALKILIRIYLTFLKQKLKSKTELFLINDEKDVLFYNSRRRYLKHLPPFAPDFGATPKSETFSDDNSEKELKSILFRIQCLLSYEDIPPECVTEVRNFINNQGNVYGLLSLKVLSATNFQEGIQLLIDFSPETLPQYLEECVSEVDAWKYAVKEIQMRISSEENSPSKSCFQQVLNDVLLLGSTSLEIEDLVEIFPRDFDDRDDYLTLAQNNAQAKHIRTLIMTTGKQMQRTLFEAVSQKNGRLV